MQNQSNDGNYIAFILTGCLWVPGFALGLSFVLVLILKKGEVGFPPPIYK